MVMTMRKINITRLLRKLKQAQDLYRKNNQGKSLLFKLVQVADTTALIETLSIRGKTLKPDYHIYTAGGASLLTAAAQNPNLMMIEYLMQKGLDPFEADNAGDTPVMYAARNKKVPLDQNILVQTDNYICFFGGLLSKACPKSGEKNCYRGVLREIMELLLETRREGLPVLKDFVDKEPYQEKKGTEPDTDSDYFTKVFEIGPYYERPEGIIENRFLREGIRKIGEGCRREEIEDFLISRMIASGTSGGKLLEQILITIGVIGILNGASPFVLKKSLEGYACIGKSFTGLNQ